MTSTVCGVVGSLLEVVSEKGTDRLGSCVDSLLIFTCGWLGMRATVQAILARASI